LELIPKYRDNIGYPRYGESWLSGITNMVKTPFFGCIFFEIFYVFNNEDFLCV